MKTVSDLHQYKSVAIHLLFQFKPSNNGWGNSAGKYPGSFYVALITDATRGVDRSSARSRLTGPTTRLLPFPLSYRSLPVRKAVVKIVEEIKMKQAWLVRAGGKGSALELFESGIIGIDFGVGADLKDHKLTEIRKIYGRFNPDDSKYEAGGGIGSLDRIVNIMKIGDSIITIPAEESTGSEK